MSEELLNVQQLVALLKERVEANPVEAKAQLNAMLLQATSSLNPADPNPQQVMMIKAMAMAITETTDYLGLDLPPYTAPADIMVLNANFQKINDWAKILNAEQVGYSNSQFPEIINAQQMLDSLSENIKDKAAKDGTLQANLNSDLLRGIALSTGAIKIWDDKSLVIENGTWAPKIAGTTTAGNHTYTAVTSGIYHRIGKLVYISARIQMSAKDNSMAGNCKVIGFPFAASSANPANYAMSIGYTAFLTLAADDKQFSVLLSGTDGTLFTLKSGADRGTVPASAIANNTAIYFSGTYPIA